MPRTTLLLTLSIAALWAAGAPAQTTSPPGLGAVEGVGVRNDLFATAAFRYQQVDKGAPGGVYGALGFRRDGYQYDELAAGPRSFLATVELHEIDYRTVPSGGTAPFVRGTNSIVVIGPDKTVALPDLQRKPGSAPVAFGSASSFYLPFDTPYPYARTTADSALLVDIIGTGVSPTGPYPIDVEGSCIVAGKGPDGCDVPDFSGAMAPMSLDSTMSVRRGATSFGWDLCVVGEPNVAVALLVGTDDDLGVCPGPRCPCEPVPVGGQIGLGIIGATGPTGQLKLSTALPLSMTLTRVPIYMQAIAPTTVASYPMGVAVSNGAVQVVPMLPSAIPSDVTSGYAPSTSSDGAWEAGSGCVIEYR